MSDNKSTCFEMRRFEKMEERINEAEKTLSRLDNELSFVNADMTRRIEGVDKDAETDLEKVRVDLRERIDKLRSELQELKKDVGADISTLNENIISVNDSVQQLFIAQTANKAKVSFNEKIIWGIVGVFGTIGLYYIQQLIKAGVGG